MRFNIIKPILERGLQNMEVYEIDITNTEEIEFIYKLSGSDFNTVMDTLDNVMVVRNCKNKLIGFICITVYGTLLEIKFLDGYKNDYYETVFKNIKFLTKNAIYKNNEERLFLQKYYSKQNLMSMDKYVECVVKLLKK